MLNAVTTALTTVLSWIGTVIKALVTVGGDGVTAGALSPLLPLFAIGIAISAVMLGIKVVRSIVWGA